jgi:hypothetical protein
MVDKYIALAGYISKHASAKHDWVEHSCASFVGGWIGIISGINPFDPYRGKITSALSWLRLMKSLGYYSMEDALKGTPEVAEKLGRGMRGDIALVSHPKGPRWDFIGILDSDGVACLAPHGLIKVSRKQVKNYWSII